MCLASAKPCAYKHTSYPTLAREHVSKGRVIRLHMPAITQRHLDAMSKF